MDQLIKDSMEYLETVEDKKWRIFIDKSILICDDWQIKRYILHMRKELITSINHMKLITFPIMKLKKDYYDLSTVNSFATYFNEEKDCLVKLRKLASRKTIQACDLDGFQISGLLLHVLGNSHSDNQERLIKYTRIIDALNDGINVSIDEDSITPINKHLVKEIKLGIDKQLNNK